MFKLKRKFSLCLLNRSSKVAFILGSVLAFSSLSYASWWGSIIHPGSHVFDKKRFEDSTRETFQMLQTKLHKMEELRLRIEEFSSLSKEAMNETQKTLHMTTELTKLNNLTKINNQNLLMDGAPFYGTTLDSYQTFMHNQQNKITESNQDVTKNLNNLVKENTTIQNKITDVATINKKGLKTETQKQVMVNGLKATMDANNALIAANATKQQIIANKAKEDAMKAASALNKSLGYSSYDPYNKDTWGDKVNDKNKPKTYSTLPGLDDNWEEDGK